jgi:hypothetical protein
LFTTLERKNITIQGVSVDEDGALANSSELCDFLLHCHIALQSTGGYASFLNGKIECPHRTIAPMVQAMLLNSGLPDTLLCYTTETATDIYQYTYHSAIKMTPYEAWYGTKPHINNLCVWGCYVHLHIPDPKKLDHRVTCGHFLGFTQSCSIVHWFDPSTKIVKHASAIRFDEYNTCLTTSVTLSPGALILSGTEPIFSESTCSVDITDQPHLGTPPFPISLQLKKNQ